MRKCSYVKQWHRKWYFTRDYIAVCRLCLSVVEPERRHDPALGGGSGWSGWEHEHSLTFIVLKESVDMETREPRREVEVLGEADGLEEVVEVARACWESGYAVEEVESAVQSLLTRLGCERAEGEG